MTSIPNDIISISFLRDDWRRISLALKMDKRDLEYRLEGGVGDDTFYYQFLQDDIARLETLIYDLEDACNV